jgi:hypothetical protein
MCPLVLLCTILDLLDFDALLSLNKRVIPEAEIQNAFVR